MTEALEGNLAAIQLKLQQDPKSINRVDEVLHLVYFLLLTGCLGWPYNVTLGRQIFILAYCVSECVCCVASGGHLAVVEYLLKNKAEVDVFDEVLYFRHTKNYL